MITRLETYGLAFTCVAKLKACVSWDKIYQSSTIQTNHNFEFIKKETENYWSRRIPLNAKIFQRRKKSVLPGSSVLSIRLFAQKLPHSPVSQFSLFIKSGPLSICDGFLFNNFVELIIKLRQIASNIMKVRTIIHL